MRAFGTQGPVNPKDNYIVSRTVEIADFIQRVKQGKYIVIFAPRQTGKTTFFKQALATLENEAHLYFPIQLNVETYDGLTGSDFYSGFSEDVHEAIANIFQHRSRGLPATLTQFLEDTKLTNAVSTRRFFRQLGKLIEPEHVVLIIDEFDAIPEEAVNGFLHALRHIYLSDLTRCPHSVGIVGVKNVRQLNYDASISPFNIQDEFHLPNFTLEQVHELLTQYTHEVGQAFTPEVIETLHKQTDGQPFLVNRLAQILTNELDRPKTQTITMEDFLEAYARILIERNTNIDHVITNIRREPNFEKILMRIAFHERTFQWTPHNETLSELTTYGIIGPDAHGTCQIRNPIYLHAIIQAFKPLINGLEDEYFSEDGTIDFTDYITPTGKLQMATLLENFKDFIARAGFKILQVPDTPQEFVGQYLLFAYLDEFVNIVRARMRLEVQTGRGRIDLLISHNERKYILETKIWRTATAYQTGKAQLAAYLKLEGEKEGYYVVFDHRQKPEPRVEMEEVECVKIHSYVIPVAQEAPSDTNI